MPHEPKTTVLLRPYSHVPTPLMQDPDMSRLSNYVEQELTKIGVPLNALTEAYSPSITVSLSEPAGSVTISPVPAVVVDYQDQIITKYAPTLGITVDPLLGTISFNGDGTVEVAMEMSAFITITRGTMAQNQSVSLIMTDGVTTWELGSVWIASVQQVNLSIGATILIRVTNDAVLTLGIYADTGGVSDYVNGYFTAQFIAGIPPRPLP